MGSIIVVWLRFIFCWSLLQDFFSVYCLTISSIFLGRTSGFCALCALQNHVMDALQSTGKILKPFHLVKNLRCILKYVDIIFWVTISRLWAALRIDFFYKGKYFTFPDHMNLLLSSALGLRMMLPSSLSSVACGLCFLTTQSGISRNFRYARQEDAHEYMVNLLESMHKCCLPSGIASESPSAYEKSLVHKIFGGHLRSQVLFCWLLFLMRSFL